MRLAIASLGALALLTACGSNAPTPQEEALPETGTDPELTANSAAAGTGNASSSLGNAGAPAPGGPVSDEGSGTGGDTASN